MTESLTRMLAAQIPLDISFTSVFNITKERQTKGLKHMENARKNLDIGLTDDEAISLVLLPECLRENGVGPYACNLSESEDMVTAIDKLTIALHLDGYVIGGNPDVTPDGCG
ncbi:hypothetical protein [Cedecea sp.]|jgi:hypothetical protein|uniref:hypothetical protein n=1 Tax=Cedecea sp. TaxID=1970739 RepID=UPI002F3F14CA